MVGQQQDECQTGQAGDFQQHRPTCDAVNWKGPPLPSPLLQRRRGSRRLLPGWELCKYFHGLLPAVNPGSLYRQSSAFDSKYTASSTSAKPQVTGTGGSAG